MSQIIPTAEPFHFAGKGANAKIGCLVTHGFTGAPKEMRWLGEYLNRQGYTVCGIRLNGHATKPEDMVRSHWQDWLLSVEDGYDLLHSCTEKVFLLGLSMGGDPIPDRSEQPSGAGSGGHVHALPTARFHAISLNRFHLMVRPVYAQKQRRPGCRLVRQGSVQTTCGIPQEPGPLGGRIKQTPGRDAKIAAKCESANAC